MDFNTLKSLNWESLKRTDLGSNYSSSFEEISSLLQRLSKLVLEFENNIHLFIPTDAGKLQAIFSQLIDLKSRAQSFNTQTGETVEQTQFRANALLQEIRDFYTVTAPKISEFQMYVREEHKQKIEEALSTYKNQTQEVVNNAQSSFQQKVGEVDQKLGELNQGLTQILQVKDNIEQLNRSVQDFSLVDTVSEYGTIFLDQSVKNRNLSRLFGVMFLILIGAGIWILVYWFLPLLKEINQPEPVADWEYYIFAFLIRFSVLFFLYVLIREVLKNYNANLHMYNLNTHRSNSLKSFDILVRNNKLPENRDAIVKEIAQTIFAHQDDGYLQGNQKEVSITDIANLISAVKK